MSHALGRQGEDLEATTPLGPKPLWIKTTAAAPSHPHGHGREVVVAAQPRWPAPGCRHGHGADVATRALSSVGVGVLLGRARGVCAAVDLAGVWRALVESPERGGARRPGCGEPLLVSALRHPWPCRPSTASQMRCTSIVSATSFEQLKTDTAKCGRSGSTELRMTRCFGGCQGFGLDRFTLCLFLVSVMDAPAATGDHH